MALPALESLVSQRALAAAARASGPWRRRPPACPMRMAFVYFPNGANQPCWWPKGEGKDFELNRTMKPLEPLKAKIQVLGGLDNLSANAGKDGGGDHARASSTFLTGVRIKKTSGADIRAGVSIDQLAAQRIGHLTRFPSLELTCDGVRKSGSCDTGYSCAYDWNMSWRTPNTPMAPEPNPRMVFERLFGSGSPGERTKNFAQRQERQKSILDAVLEDARDLHGQLAARDLSKLDEYLTGVREIEARIQQCERLGESPDPAVETPAGIPSSHREHVRLMFDMMSLAFRTDSTRIATLILAHDGSNRAFPEIGIPEGHHSLSHHRGKKENLEKVAQIDLFYMEEYARFLRGLDEAKECRRHLRARQLDDRLRLRQLRRQPPQSRQPADHPGRRRRRDVHDGAIRQTSLQAPGEPLPEHGRPPGYQRSQVVRRFGRPARQCVSDLVRIRI